MISIYPLEVLSLQRPYPYCLGEELPVGVEAIKLGPACGARGHPGLQRSDVGLTVF